MLWYCNIQGFEGLRRVALCVWRRVVYPGAEFCMKGGSRWRSECWKHVPGRSHSETRNADAGNSMFYFGNFARMQIIVQKRQKLGWRDKLVSGKNQPNLTCLNLSVNKWCHEFYIRKTATTATTTIGLKEKCTHFQSCCESILVFLRACWSSST